MCPLCTSSQSQQHRICRCCWVRPKLKEAFFAVRSNVFLKTQKANVKNVFPSPWFVFVYLLCLWQSFHIFWLFFIWLKQCFAHLCETGRWATNVAYPRVGWVRESRNNHKRPQLSSPSHWQQLYMSSSVFWQAQCFPSASRKETVLYFQYWLLLPTSFSS